MKPNEGIGFVPENISPVVPEEPSAEVIGKARQALEDVASNVDVIASGEVERRMNIFKDWIISNFQDRELSSFSPHEKEAIIRKIEDINGITYPLARLFSGIPNHIQTWADLYAQARKAFRNGI